MSVKLEIEASDTVALRHEMARLLKGHTPEPAKEGTTVHAGQQSLEHRRLESEVLQTAKDLIKQIPQGKEVESYINVTPGLAGPANRLSCAIKSLIKFEASLD